MKRCHAPHPETGDPCLLPEGIHLSHAATGGVIWADEEATREFNRRPQKRAVTTNPHRKGGGTPKVRPETLARLNEMAERTAPDRHAARTDTGVPEAAVTAWNKDAWVAETKAALLEFLKARTEPFTTPEHFWPLITAPREMRAMSLVVQAALRGAWMEECGSVRLKGNYATADGVAFQANKIVPIYQSRIHQGLDSKDS